MTKSMNHSINQQLVTIIMSALPDKIGSLLFCPNCGSLLDVPGDEDFIKCAPCGAVQNAKALRQKRQLVNTAAALGDNNKPQEATIKEKCPGCGNDEMNFHTLQLRSADEGTTVFYDCPKCGYKFSQNN
ncbi:likely RNA polymerase II core subunit [Pseudozyma hubeiensis SY62]|uniref:DNA-directed RNA polymerase I subunit RPA12 n=1 Tax=Pseudozyma hubeiensis (strain SY62) TaxID=1305764 RepID=R9PB71_PSEHS|nr:likely RNA polymerase II core subunit [Pseudozyma hubeiensis SY62]GAC98482.1 likely RNA polymerase II core subunit [Pseudozyma hubeiensis SY62]